MRFKEFLEESKQVGILYHYTNLSNLITILKQNILKTSSGMDDLRPFAVSFTRNKNFHKKGQFLKSGWNQCRIVVDGDKLSNKYKVKPRSEIVDGDFLKRSKYYQEQEEFVKTDIKNLLSYTKRIDIFSNKFIDTVYLGNSKYNVVSFIEMSILKPLNVDWDLFFKKYPLKAHTTKHPIKSDIIYSVANLIEDKFNIKVKVL
ncbi:MAG: hypothetical protein ACOC22_04280 [bacterium]